MSPARLPLPLLAEHRDRRRLTAVKGIGIWTAQMFLIFALRRRRPHAALGPGVSG